MDWVTIEWVPNWRGGIHIGATAGGENGSDDFGAFEADNGFSRKGDSPRFFWAENQQETSYYLGNYICRFPKMRVPLVIIHFNRIFPYKPSIVGYPHLWNPPYIYNKIFLYCKCWIRNQSIEIVNQLIRQGLSGQLLLHIWAESLQG